MKAFVKLFLLIIAFAVLGSTTVYSADTYFTINGFTFSINNDGCAVIHKYEGSQTEVEIPDKLLGADVTEIDDYAFINNNAITSVSFDNAKSLRKIGVSAFHACSKLKEIDLPKSLTDISFGAFRECSELERVSVESGVTSIPAQCFYKCEKLNYVELPESIEALSERCFACCGSLGFLVLPDALTSIADNAFDGSSTVEIYCSENSYAQTFAEEKGISYAFIRDYDLGDANLDGQININDATAIQKHILGINELPRYQGKTFADVNKDGEITIRDATLIQMKLAGILDF